MNDDLPELSAIRRVHRTLDPYHNMVYFSSHAANQYEACDLSGAAGYFASRSAALGMVPHQVVAATFFNFAPNLVASSMHRVWEKTTPLAMLDARHLVVDMTLRDVLGSDVIGSDKMREAAHLARDAAQGATQALAGRPLFAAHAALPWPDPPHLQLWHAITLLREFRGDAHIAALVTAGLDGLDALILHAASGTIPTVFLQSTRGWGDDEWDATVALHREHGWLAPGDGDNGEPKLSASGAAMREEIEIATDRACILPWAAIGSHSTEHLRELVKPWSRALADAMFSGLAQS